MRGPAIARPLTSAPSSLGTDIKEKKERAVKLLMERLEELVDSLVMAESDVEVWDDSRVVNGS